MAPRGQRLELEEQVEQEEPGRLKQEELRIQVALAAKDSQRLGSSSIYYRSARSHITGGHRSRWSIVDNNDLVVATLADSSTSTTAGIGVIHHTGMGGSEGMTQDSTTQSSGNKTSACKKGDTSCYGCP